MIRKENYLDILERETPINIIQYEEEDMFLLQKLYSVYSILGILVLPYLYTAHLFKSIFLHMLIDICAKAQISYTET